MGGDETVIIEAYVGIYKDAGAKQPLKNAEGKDNVSKKTINNKTVDVFTGLDQMLNYAILPAGNYFWCVTVKVNETTVCTPYAKAITVKAPAAAKLAWPRAEATKNSITSGYRTADRPTHKRDPSASAIP